MKINLKDTSGSSDRPGWGGGLTQRVGHPPVELFEIVNDPSASTKPVINKGLNQMVLPY
jgi:hypothetical protein